MAQLGEETHIKVVVESRRVVFVMADTEAVPHVLDGGIENEAGGRKAKQVCAIGNIKDCWNATCSVGAQLCKHV